ncbi:unnamed protein product, partial [Effrenium voratum]
AMEIAESYGTKGSSPNPKYVEKWKERLNQLVGTKPGPAVKLIPQGVYVTPANVPLIKAWSEKGGDPETEAQVWLEEGAPLGIEKEIKTCRIFPLSDEGPQERGLPDASAQLHRGDMTNNKEEAEIELCRYEEKGYMKRLSRQELLEKFPHLTVENLEVKRRVVIDLRRSRGNAKARLPEKLVLPRPDDAVRMVREIRTAQEVSGATRNPGWAMEFVLIDISDAFMTLPVHKDELGHGLAPYPVLGAPLRLLQSVVDAKEGAHQVYLDDSLWCFAGTLRRRNYLLAFVLTTMVALGLKIALGKGERANDGKASWLAGVLPRAKWTVAIFYAVMYSVDEGVASGVEGVRLWLVEFLNGVVNHPTRLLKVGGPPLAEITIATDASPEGIGAVIFINNVAISALAGPVGESDARMLRFELGSSSSQGILEALAVLVAVRTWANKLSDFGLVLRVQSDSTTALALIQRLAHSSPSLNFLGAELALTLEKLAINRIVPCHIPGVANFLSRPSKWKDRPMPEHLHGVKVIPVAGELPAGADRTIRRKAPWLDELHLLLGLSFIGLMWVLKIILCTQGGGGGPVQAMMGHYGLSPTSRLRQAPNWGARGNLQDVLNMRAALGSKKGKDKDPGPYGGGSDFEAVSLCPERIHTVKEALEGTKVVCDGKAMGTKGCFPSTSKSPGLKEIMNGSSGNLAKGLLLKPAVDWLRARWSPKKREGPDWEKGEGYRLPGGDARAGKRADLPVRYTKVKASTLSALTTAKDPWRRKMAVNRLEKDF